MQPTKSFLIVLSLVTVAGAVIVATPNARPAQAAQEATLPLSTALTAQMIDYFGLDAAYDRPSIAALTACSATPACGASDTSEVRIRNAAGATVPAFDSQPGSVIEQVRRVKTTPSAGVAETRVIVRRYSTDDHGRVVMNGRDSIVTIDAGDAVRTPSAFVRVRRFADVRYLSTDPRYPWPLNGLVTLELSRVTGSAAPTPVAGVAAVSFDGTPIAQIITTSAVTHRANLQKKVLDTTVPDR